MHWLIKEMNYLNEKFDEEFDDGENEANWDKDNSQSGNPKLADALAKVIRMGKSKNGKPVVLSKAKLYNQRIITKKSYDFEIGPDPNKKVKTKAENTNPEIVKVECKDVKPNKNELKKLKVTKQEKLQRNRLKPSPLDREKERPLMKIATKGVVQLFNAVRQQQSAINKEIKKPGVTECKKEKILKSIDKKAFLDVLMGKISSNQQCSVRASSNLEEDVKSEPEEEPTWQVLRDDFMMGAKLKDWDKNVSMEE